MRSIIFSVVGFCAAVFAQPLSGVDQYVATESIIAKAGVLANIGPSGSKSSGAAVCIGHII
jgi:glucoamylase